MDGHFPAVVSAPSPCLNRGPRAVCFGRSSSIHFAGCSRLIPALPPAQPPLDNFAERAVRGFAESPQLLDRRFAQGLRLRFVRRLVCDIPLCSDEGLSHGAALVLMRELLAARNVLSAALLILAI